MSVTEKTQVGTIDMTPSWNAMISLYVIMIEDGRPELRHNAIAELRRMAQAADAWVAHCKKEKP